jgi:hypothetical protein
MLATRAEYIGGYPELLHGRFLYLALGGTLGSPELEIRLPRALGEEAEVFSLPVLDFQRTLQLDERTGSEANLSVTLVNVTFRAKLLGENALLSVEYIGSAGRKHTVQPCNWDSSSRVTARSRTGITISSVFRRRQRTASSLIPPGKSCLRDGKRWPSQRLRRECRQKGFPMRATPGVSRL